MPQLFSNLLKTKRTLREIRLLRGLHHPNVLSLVDVFVPQDPARFDEIYVATELMDTDLHQIIASPQPLTDEHAQYFMWQLLCGLRYIHASNVLHRDLKPANILLNKARRSSLSSAITAPPCSALLLPAPPCPSLLLPAPPCSSLLLPAPPCPSLLLTAPPCPSLLLTEGLRAADRRLRPGPRLGGGPGGQR
eukprot:SAG31_NODE_5307_length_2620_cov_2.005157_1_plen_191_part_10